MKRLSRRPPAVGLILAGFTILVGGALLSAEPQQTSAILAVGFERGDTAVSDIGLEDVRLSGGDESISIVDIGPPGAFAQQWQLVVYIDQELTGTRSILQFLESLTPLTATMTGLGEVQLVLAGDSPSTVVRTSDPALLNEIFFQQSLRSSGGRGLRELRLQLLESLGEVDDPSDAEIQGAATTTLAAELALLRSRRDELIHWVATQGQSEQPRALFFLSEGMGAGFADFYADFLSDPATTARQYGGPPDLEELATVLTSYGWALFPTVVTPALDEDDDAFSLRTNQSIGFRLKLGQRNRGEEEEASEPPDLRLEDGRLQALSDLALSTGGRAAGTLEELPALFDGLTQRVPVEITLPDTVSAPLPIEIEASSPRVRVRAPRWVGGSPQAVAEVRIRRSLAGDGDSGALPLRARIHYDPAQMDSEAAELDLLVDLSATDDSPQPLAPIQLRVSVGVHQQNDDLAIHHYVVEADPASGDTFSWRQPLQLPSATDAAIVVVENLATATFGENFAEFIASAEVATETTSIPKVAPSRPEGPAVRLQPLPKDARTGKVRIRTRTRPDVSEVVFLLDGERVGAPRRAPFDARVDLGRVAEQRSIVAIAYDSSGQELGRDGLVVNEAATSFWVQISEPAPSDRVGPVDVVPSYRLPAGTQLDKIDYYWNDTLVGTSRQQPHRQRVLIPVDSPAGYIRVVAMLSNGKTAEDVVLMNTQRFETEINVELVELYVVVTDRVGKPVQGLDRADFIIREEEEVQDVESFAVAGDLPLTLGLAIDSSLSLFKKLPEVQSAATNFVGNLQADRDRAFLVEYGTSPRVVQPITGNLDRISSGIRSLHPSGSTAVWEGVTLSLQQLQESAGRKALVVFYDGDDEDENYSFKKTLDLARKTRIPIYLIVMNNEAARTDGKGFSVRSRVARLDQLARTGGGRVFYVRTDQNLTPIFEDISEELRSHYLLTYYPQRPVEQPEWRPINVEMLRPELSARTLSGYGGG